MATQGGKPPRPRKCYCFNSGYPSSYSPNLRPLTFSHLYAERRLAAHGVQSSISLPPVPLSYFQPQLHSVYQRVTRTCQRTCDTGDAHARDGRSTAAPRLPAPMVLVHTYCNWRYSSGPTIPPIRCAGAQECMMGLQPGTSMAADTALHEADSWAKRNVGAGLS